MNVIGTAGPTIFMTDDSASERGALRSVFPECRLLLCTFHVTKAVGDWLGRQSMATADREACHNLLKELMYCATATEFANTLYVD